MILSVEPMESLRYLPMLSPDGWLVTNTQTFVNIPNYPDKDELMAEIRKVKHHIAIDADRIATDMGALKSANMVVLGAATPFLDIDYSLLEKAIGMLFGRKGENVVAVNLQAMNAGRDFSLKILQT
jgi:indolepyruvate ferredoxin oxidoreductase beta subunit